MNETTGLPPTPAPDPARAAPAVNADDLAAQIRAVETAPTVAFPAAEAPSRAPVPAAAPARDAEGGRHAFDAFAFVAGVLCLAVGLWVILDPEIDLDLRWVVPGLLAVLGVTALIESVRRARG
jgi:hypothetical protein